MKLAGAVAVAGEAPPPGLEHGCPRSICLWDHLPRKPLLAGFRTIRRLWLKKLRL